MWKKKKKLEQHFTSTKCLRFSFSFLCFFFWYFRTKKKNQSAALWLYQKQKAKGLQNAAVKRRETRQCQELNIFNCGSFLSAEMYMHPLASCLTQIYSFILASPFSSPSTVIDFRLQALFQKCCNPAPLQAHQWESQVVQEWQPHQSLVVHRLLTASARPCRMFSGSNSWLFPTRPTNCVNRRSNSGRWRSQRRSADSLDSARRLVHAITPPRHHPLVRPSDGPETELFDLSLGVTSLYISRAASLPLPGQQFERRCTGRCAVE